VQRGVMNKSAGRKGAVWEKVRKQALYRDMSKNARCWICGQEIDYRAPAGTPDAWEPDHYLPVDDFPEFGNDITNLRPAHSSCNRARKKADIADKSLGSRSRDWGL
jgi:5-methylcytosine-specific restriction endonuclease McrA